MSSEPSLEPFDRGLLWVFGLPVGLASIGLHFGGLWLVARGAIGLGWIGALASQFAFVFACACASVAVLLVSTGGRFRTAGRIGWVFASLVLLAVEFAGRASVYIAGTAYDLRAFYYFFEEWGMIEGMVSAVIDPQAKTAQALGGAALVALLIGYLSFRTPPVPVAAWTTRKAMIQRLMAAGVVALMISVIPMGPGALPRSVAAAPLIWLPQTAASMRWQVEPKEPVYRHAPELAPTPEQTPNLVVVTLESIGRRATSLGGPHAVTPNLAALADRSIDFERTLVTFPHSTKAIVPMFCGVDPWRSHRVVEGRPGGVRADCLPGLLGELGYRSVFFRSGIEEFEGWPTLIDSAGFDDFFAAETLPTEGFEMVNYFGFEDDIMLEPSREWLREQDGKPFMMVYNTGASHHDYGLPSDYPIQHYVDAHEHNAYLNAVAYVDRFLGKVLTLLEEEGVLENTVVMVIGDHGESFGHHERQHDLSLFDEVLEVPFLLHYGDRYAGKEHRRVGQGDLPGTALTAMGFEQVGEPKWPSALEPDEDRVFFASCWHVGRCASITRGDHKLIHRFGDVADELHNLRDDPHERHDLAAEQPELVLELRQELDAWYVEQSQWARWMVENHPKP